MRVERAGRPGGSQQAAERVRAGSCGVRAGSDGTRVDARQGIRQRGRVGAGRWDGAAARTEQEAAHPARARGGSAPYESQREGLVRAAAVYPGHRRGRRWGLLQQARHAAPQSRRACGQPERRGSRGGTRVGGEAQGGEGRPARDRRRRRERREGVGQRRPRLGSGGGLGVCLALHGLLEEGRGQVDRHAEAREDAAEVRRVHVGV